MIISKDKTERTFQERFILGYHEFICKACHNYQIQNSIIERSFSKHKKRNTAAGLSPQKKAEIIELLQKEAS